MSILVTAKHELRWRSYVSTCIYLSIMFVRIYLSLYHHHLAVLLSIVYEYLINVKKL